MRLLFIVLLFFFISTSFAGEKIIYANKFLQEYKGKLGRWKEIKAFHFA